MLKKLTLTLFLTRRAGLHHWHQVGSLDREVALYRHLAQELQQVNFITYGGKRDQAYVSQLDPLQIHPTPSNLPVFASWLLLQRFYRPILTQSDILKTNQIPGSEIALWAKKKYRKKLIVRCGYLYGLFMQAHTKNPLRIKQAYRLEGEAFAQADAGVLTSERDRQWVIKHYQIPSDKLYVIPNYVVTDIFKPMPEIEKKYDLVCVSKAALQKNLPALLQAMSNLKEQGGTTDRSDISLLLIGSAAQDEALDRQIQTSHLKVTRIKRVANFDLPRYLNQARCFILPSLYEGHPKALLEAMSCGLPCIGTNVVGIKEDLRHGEIGYLCDPTPNTLAQAIKAVLEDLTWRQQLGHNARRYILQHYALEAVLNLELALLSTLMSP